MSNGPGELERSKQEEVGVVVESDVLRLLAMSEFKDAELDYRRRVDRSAIGSGWDMLGRVIAN